MRINLRSIENTWLLGPPFSVRSMRESNTFIGVAGLIVLVIAWVSQSMRAWKSSLRSGVTMNSKRVLSNSGNI